MRHIISFWSTCTFLPSIIKIFQRYSSYRVDKKFYADAKNNMSPHHSLLGGDIIKPTGILIQKFKDTHFFAQETQKVIYSLSPQPPRPPPPPPPKKKKKQTKKTHPAPIDQFLRSKCQHSINGNLLALLLTGVDLKRCLWTVIILFIFMTLYLYRQGQWTRAEKSIG